jgi:acyl-CoA hydrolase
MTTNYDTYAMAASKIIEQVGKTIVIAVPLGIGKPIGLLNALYRLAESDQSINFTIITALTLVKPNFSNELEKRFAEPVLDRLLQNYEDPIYEKARRLQQLPANIRVIEFFLTPGNYLHNSYVQQNYISSSYTNVASDLLNYSINVLAQQVARSKDNPQQFSLSSNSDLFHQVAEHLRKQKLENKKIAIVAEVNSNLPFMPGIDAVVSAETFTDVVDAGHYKTLFSLPREELTVQDHLIGLYTSCLIKDGGCMQIGIGKLSTAVANALIMRHEQNAEYCKLMNKLLANQSLVDSLDVFKTGLYASTEMFSDDYMYLYKHDILKKRVYDHAGLQRLLNLHKINDDITSQTIEVLLDNKIINSKLTNLDFQFLIKFGIFKDGISFEAGNLLLKSGEKIPADLSLLLSKQAIFAKCLGDKLKLGKIMHAGFFIGSAEFYNSLNNLSLKELQLIEMTSIARTNSLVWSYELLSLQRQHARFINSAMMVTLGGAVISDGLNNLQEVSGVGGQFDFVNMAKMLPNAKSIIVCHSVRKTNKGLKSNILWDYSNFTIPRYLRDVIITEYGIADCRSKTDAEVIKAILNITDSRFQQELLLTAKKYGKLPVNYEIPKCFQQNYPEVITSIVHELQNNGYCKPYPFGSDFTKDEIVIQKAFMYLKNCTKLRLFIIFFISLIFVKKDDRYAEYLLRMKLYHPKTISDFIYKKLLMYSLNTVIW